MDSIIIAGAALLIQTVGLVLTIQRSATATRDRIERLSVALERRPDRIEMQGTLDRERAEFSARCQRHMERCDGRHKLNEDRLAALARRVSP